MPRGSDGGSVVDGFSLPGAFWSTFALDDMRALLAGNGVLTRDQACTLWRLRDRQEPPPRRVVIEFDVARAVELWPVRGRPVAPQDVPRVLLDALQAC